MNKIVVGVDGSEASREALRWAVDEAKVRGARVVAVNVWNWPTVPAFGTVGLPLTDELETQLKADSREVLDAVIRDVAGDEAGVVIDRAVVSGSPASQLIAAAEDADLLVVGSRGRGGFAGLLLGSVSQQCAHHAHCPIVICHRRT